MTKPFTSTKRQGLAVLALMVLLSGCAYDLGEHEGAFSEASVIDPNPEYNTCPHFFNYDYAHNHTASSAYPSADYHYVACAAYGQDPYCKFAPTFALHEKVEVEVSAPRIVTLYNGRQYVEIRERCRICGLGQSRRYVLLESAGEEAEE